MCYMSDGCKNDVKFGGIGRALTEDSIFKELTHNTSTKQGFVGYTANFPATIIPLNLKELGVIKCA